MKEKLRVTGPKGLIKIVVQLYDLNKDNKLFLTTRLLDSPENQALLIPYKEIIEQNMYPDEGFKISLKTAKKAISDYRKAIGDEDGVLELLIFYL